MYIKYKLFFLPPSNLFHYLPPHCPRTQLVSSFRSELNCCCLAHTCSWHRQPHCKNWQWASPSTARTSITSIDAAYGQSHGWYGWQYFWQSWQRLHRHWTREMFLESLVWIPVVLCYLPAPSVLPPAVSTAMLAYFSVQSQQNP